MNLVIVSFLYREYCCCEELLDVLKGTFSSIFFGLLKMFKDKL